jgi:hypothetical protein
MVWAVGVEIWKLKSARRVVRKMAGRRRLEGV